MKESFSNTFISKRGIKTEIEYVTMSPSWDETTTNQRVKATVVPIKIQHQTNPTTKTVIVTAKPQRSTQSAGNNLETTTAPTTVKAATLDYGLDYKEVLPRMETTVPSLKRQINFWGQVPPQSPWVKCQSTVHYGFDVQFPHYEKYFNKV